MIRQKYRIPKNYLFNRKDLVLNKRLNTIEIKLFKNSYDNNRIRVIIPKKTFKKATDRNKIRRRTISIIKDNIIAQGNKSYDYILYLKPVHKIDNHSPYIYKELKKTLTELIQFQI